MKREKILEATGCCVTEEILKKENKVYITDFGAACGNDPVTNTKAINAAIEKAHEMGGAEVDCSGRRLSCIYHTFEESC